MKLYETHKGWLKTRYLGYEKNTLYHYAKGTGHTTTLRIAK